MSIPVIEDKITMCECSLARRMSVLFECIVSFCVCIVTNFGCLQWLACMLHDYLPRACTIFIKLLLYWNYTERWHKVP